jgi:hypothetical protein
MMSAVFNQGGGSSHSWSKEAAADGDLQAAGPVRKPDMGVQTGSNTLLI